MEVAGLRHDLCALQQIPAAQKDPLLLRLVEALGRVAPERQGPHQPPAATHGGVVARRKNILRLLHAERRPIVIYAVSHASSLRSQASVSAPENAARDCMGAVW